VVVALDARVASWIGRLFFEFTEDYAFGMALGRWVAEKAPECKTIGVGIMYDRQSGINILTWKSTRR
jgi:hypothetical protein